MLMCGDKVKKSMLEKYDEGLPLKLLVQSIPHFGNLIDTVISHLSQRVSQKRVRLMLDFLNDGLNEVKLKSVSKDWIYGEEFHDVLLRAMESSVKTRSREKIMLNAMILCNVLTVDNDGMFMPEDYLIVLEDLSPLEVKVLLTMYREYQPYSNEGFRTHRWYTALSEQCGLDEEAADFVILRLTRTGFVQRVDGFLSSPDPFDITDSFRTFMQYLAIHPFGDKL